ncbi:unnamed protein product [Clavelina lepadiformis]|uniref:Alpha-L-arabinofuranosidase B arabinose-binding domain-containing protein n=1 Tax=Clavelina lepadiformis TaxID=159417 RepID=A0ABP0GMP9_CLALP
MEGCWILLFFALFCATKCSFATYGQSEAFLIVSYNFPKHAIGVDSSNAAWIKQEEDERFKIISPGLTGTPGSVSFQSLTKPESYLRHRNYLLHLDRYQNKDLYRNDATFMPRRNLFYEGYTVFESINFRDYYIRHQNYRLKISREDRSTLLHKDASFLALSLGKKAIGPFNLRSYNFPKYSIGIKNSRAYIVNSEGDRFFIVSPGLTGTPGSVSFQSEDSPTLFLRHQGYLLYLHSKEDSDLYRNDASFLPRHGLFYQGYIVYESENFPNYYIRHQNYRLKISREDGSTLLHKDASFLFAEKQEHYQQGPAYFFSYNFPKYTFGLDDNNAAWISNQAERRFYVVSPGLTGTPRSVSFQSVDNQNFYLRHRGYLLYLDQYESADLYKNDASFMPRKNLFYPGYTVYESENFPNYYIRHQNYRLRISQEDNSELLHKDASFITTEDAVGSEGSILLLSYNYPKYFIGLKHSNEAWILLDNGERFVIISPGLTGSPGTVSFKSVDQPNHYLRHQNYLIHLHPYHNSDLYRNDASFYPRQDLFYSGYTVYESENYPRYYIRHQGYRLKISEEDNSELLHKDSSFVSILG